MRKTWISVMLILFLVAIVTGCGQTSPYGTPVPIKQLKWGMNEKETMTRLGITEKEITATSNGFMLKERIELYNRPAEVNFLFSEHFLLGITAIFKPADVAFVEQEITKQRGPGEPQYNAKNELIQLSWNDGLLQDNKKWLAVVEKIYRDNGMKATENPMEDGVNVTGKPITSWVLILDKNSPRYGVVSFYGQVAAMLNYPERFFPTGKVEKE
ncbi:hypothetical protein A8990_101438 [Paenibacillus taihuensis]|uniref:Lipoprotein n=1 Tax=Paenibacillus taihuensis TaxID=1156355 RepID=A0A3D9SFG0_9BACL|nr:hypothetical protein [Paenibacillus taihuensis]REE94642.1 hypothetical protein A8990_101438 [Paenibacillus taihuensis]